jgi:hypothetical protein
MRISRLQSGGCIVNYACSSTCGHCLYGCSNKREKDYLTPDVAEFNFQTISRLGCYSVHIGGGEPLLHPEDLVNVLLVAKRLGIRVEYVETNASWFKDTASAKEILRSLMRAGLSGLMISVSPFHNEYIPYARTKGVIAAARSVGLPLFLWVDEFCDILESLPENVPHSLEEYREKFGSGFDKTIVSYYRLTHGGRALEYLFPLTKHFSAETVITKTPPCSARLTNSHHFHMDLFGNYIPGLCCGLSIARDDLGKNIDKEKYPYLTLLNDKGIGGLYKMACDLYGFIPSKEGYISHCHLCFELRCWIVGKIGTGSTDLQPAGYYRELFPHYLAA